jgi:hypothetical protein
VPTTGRSTRRGQNQEAYSSLGLVWMQAFPRGSLRFPRPTIPRVQLPRFSPPDHLVAHGVLFPRSFQGEQSTTREVLNETLESLTRSRIRRRRRWDDAHDLRRHERGPLERFSSTAVHLLPASGTPPLAKILSLRQWL